MTGAWGGQMILFYGLTSERGFRPHQILNNLIQNMSCAKVDCATPVFSKQPWLAEFCSLVATSNTTLKLHQIAQHPSNYVHAIQSKIITPHHVQYDDFLIHWLMFIEAVFNISSKDKNWAGTLTILQKSESFTYVITVSHDSSHNHICMTIYVLGHWMECYISSEVQRSLWNIYKSLWSM